MMFTAPRIESDQIEFQRNQLPSDRQEELLQSFRGTRPVVDEDPSLMSAMLQEMEDHLGAMPMEEKMALARAQEVCPEYVDTINHRMLFLRKSEYDPKKAAQGIAHYWNVKYDLMGEERTFHEFRLSDLSDLEQGILTSGCFRVMPDTDNAGRGIILSDRFKWYVKNTEESRRSMVCSLVLFAFCPVV